MFLFTPDHFTYRVRFPLLEALKEILVILQADIIMRRTAEQKDEGHMFL